MNIPNSYLSYLDPTSGSLAFQMAIGGVVTVGATLRLYRDALRRLLRRGSGAATPKSGVDEKEELPA